MSEEIKFYKNLFPKTLISFELQLFSVRNYQNF